MEYYLAIKRNNTLNMDEPKRRKPNAKTAYSMISFIGNFQKTPVQGSRPAGLSRD